MAPGQPRGLATLAREPPQRLPPRQLERPVPLPQLQCRRGRTAQLLGFALLRRQLEQLSPAAPGLWLLPLYPALRRPAADQHPQRSRRPRLSRLLLVRRDRRRGFALAAPDRW